MGTDASKGPLREGPPSAPGGLVGRVAIIFALVTAFALVGVGAFRVISQDPTDRSHAAAPGSPGSPATSPDGLHPSGRARDVVYDLRTKGTRPLPAHIAAVALGGNYQVSPDGSRIAFTAPGVEDEYRQIYVAAIDGGRPVRVTQGPIPISPPRWSPDGTKIVYEAIDPSGQSDIFVADLDAPRSKRNALVAEGSDAQLRQVGAAPSFGPDGRTILFTRATGDGRSDLWITSLAGASPRILIRDAAYGSFSPDGLTIAYQRMIKRDFEESIWPDDQGIWLADADGTDRLPLPNGDRGFDENPLSWKHLGPLWSPDGTRIAYLHPDNGIVYVADVSSRSRCCSALRSLSRVGSGGWPSWFDDDRLIVQGYGLTAPAFTLADVAGTWFAIERGDPTYLLISNKGKYVLEYAGGVGSALDESGTVEVVGDSLRFRAGDTKGCKDERWDLRSVSLTQPGRMKASDGVCRGILLGGRPTIWRLADDRIAIPDSQRSAPVRRSDVVGTWADGGAFYRFAADGSFASYWADPDWPYFQGFEPGDAGTWAFRDGRLRILYARGRMCPGPDGVMGLGVPTYDDRAHRLEVSRVRLARPGVMSLSTVRDDCFDTVGARSLRSRLFPSPRAFEHIATLATLVTEFGDNWEIEIFRDVMRDDLCIGRPHRPTLCGPRHQPVPGWTGSLDRPLAVMDRQWVSTFSGQQLFAWGAFAQPVASIEVSGKDASGRWVPVERPVVDLPNAFGHAFRLFAVDCICSRLRVVGLDASGQRIASVNW